MPSPLLPALLAHIDSVFEGPNGDYAAVLEALAGVSAAQALWEPSPSQNSIWQIVEHLISSKQWLIDMLNDKNPPSPKWVEPSGGETEWQASLVRLKDLHQQLKAAIQVVPEKDLMEVPVPEWGKTLLELILSSGPAHEAHHSGQLDYLKGLQAK